MVSLLIIKKLFKPDRKQNSRAPCNLPRFITYFPVYPTFKDIVNVLKPNQTQGGIYILVEKITVVKFQAQAIPHQALLLLLPGWSSSYSVVTFYVALVVIKSFPVFKKLLSSQLYQHSSPPLIDQTCIKPCCCKPHKTRFTFSTLTDIASKISKCIVILF